ncbi:MAG: DUF4115 domain-containing protein [Chloroflexaceae bacterium]|jgi:cytoskeletal protein RodZ|nr:DUF4115 domain-containing protein [Chloroflexaceae bacterium]
MSLLGTQLREAREKKGVSLAQASMETRILQQSLLALEEGAYQRLPGDVVARGFLRNYAQYLGLPPEEMIEIYRQERGASDKIKVVPAAHPIRGRTYSLPSFFTVFIATVVLVALGYMGLVLSGRLASTPSVAVAFTATAQPATPTVLPTAIPVTSVSVFTPTPGAVAGGVATPQVTATPVLPTPTPLAPIVVDLTILPNNQSWVRVIIDGVVFEEGILGGGINRQYLAQRQITILAGNPPAAEVTVNGLQVGAIGTTPGSPATFSWPQ